MVKQLDEAVERYTEALRGYKKLCDDMFGGLPEGCGEIFLSAKDYLSVREFFLHLQGMAYVLGLTEQEVRTICGEIGITEGPHKIWVD